MERPTFEAMLKAATGVERDGDAYIVAEEYILSLYIGKPGQGMELSQVVRLELAAAFCEASSSEHNTVYYVEYSSLHGLSVRPPTGAGGRRAGFS
jgi:antirestriction protein